MLGADQHWFPEAELIELNSVLTSRLVIDLVGEEEDRLACAPQQLGHLLVCRDHAGLRVHDEEEHRGVGHRLFDLASDELREAALGRSTEAACIDKREAAIIRYDIGVDTVAGCAGHLFDQRLAAADQAVEQCRFADVRPAYERHDRQRTRV